jgi:hypothetical protein
MLVLKSYVHCAATFGDIGRAFRSALSWVVSLYSAAGEFTYALHARHI